MTDEEMADKHAEEYVMREDTITENDRVPFDNGYGFQTVDFEKEVKKGYKDGFLAGLKAGRPQWHKVADGDLPKKNKEYVVKVKEYGDISVYIGRYWKKEKLFTGSYLKELDVIAWCEIPTFDKE